MADENTVADKTPHIEGEYDQARMERLVANLRAQVDRLKKERDEALASVEELSGVRAQLEQVTQEAADASRELSALKEATTKARLLAQRDLPESAARFIVGDSEEEWAESADLLAQLRKPASDEPVGDDGEVPLVPDPVISAKNPRLTDDARQMQEAQRLFGTN